MSELKHKANLACIKIYDYFLKDLLHMPIETTILDAKYDHFDKTIIITVEHYELKEVEEGAEIPLVNPIIHVINWDWNQGE